MFCVAEEFKTIEHRLLVLMHTSWVDLESKPASRAKALLTTHSIEAIIHKLVTKHAVSDSFQCVSDRVTQDDGHANRRSR